MKGWIIAKETEPYRSESTEGNTIKAF